MKTADIVIGANYGDEGKGLVTDFLAAKNGQETIVVRFNGGAQAGHTVVTPDHRRHVFSHFGCGSFQGAPTFLSRFFVANPILFLKEHALLLKKSVNPIAYIDSNTPITTPYDMMINQIAEESRGQKRHGSCGMGFGETIERTENSEISILYSDLLDKQNLKSKLHLLRDRWLPQRLKMLGIENLSNVWKERFLNNSIIDRYIEDTEQFLSFTQLADKNLMLNASNIVFEGAQGLLLDQKRGSFPHVTRSNTGIKNAFQLADEAGIRQLNPYYITRAYMTRHGAGPLPYELEQAPYTGIKDQTNITNQYQGHLRFAWLDIDKLQQSIADDLSDTNSNIAVHPAIAVTCLDQVDNDIGFIDGGELKTASQAEFLSTIQRKTSIQRLMTSRGPTRNDITA